LALGVKETAVTYPLALLLWDLTCGRSLKTALRSSGASWTVLLVALVFFMANTPYLSALQTSAVFNTLEGNAATQLGGLFYLLGQWALPLWLNIDPDVPVRQSLAQALHALAGFIALLLSAVWAWRRRPWLAFAIGWVLLHLLLLHTLLPRLDVANDRQLYLASWPLALALVVELQLRLPARLANGLLVALLAGGAVLTALRNHDYRSEVALWEQTVQLSPHKSRVHSNLGYAYWMDGHPALARRAFLDALKLDAGNVKARLNLRRLNAEQAALNPS
jgi:tetratricopeptide (TPR) repeat protein